jgi:hypothetical protein
MHGGLISLRDERKDCASELVERKHEQHGRDKYLPIVERRKMKKIGRVFQLRDGKTKSRKICSNMHGGVGGSGVGFRREGTCSKRQEDLFVNQGKNLDVNHEMININVEDQRH